MNTLYYGDNLNILRRYIRDESVDLVYLDPPFNSNRDYNVLFKDESGLEADSQIIAFEDTWHWKGAASTYGSRAARPSSPRTSPTDDDLIPRQATRSARCSRPFAPSSAKTR
ncbi:hypothetical protein BH10ACI3_BH10ACI3_18460 [soil metagenome]